MAIIAVTLILFAAIILLVSEKFSTDLTAIGIIVVLMVAGIITPSEALIGFSNPAIVTVAVLFVVSRALVRSGALDFITASVMKFSKGNPKRLLFLSLFLVGGFSSFLNNTPVVVLFISITIAVCSEYSLSPSKFLMPISFVSILAGTSTLIGTSTNIIVSDLAVQNGMAPIAMFELSALGIPMAMAGAVFLYFFSSRMLPAHKEPIGEVKNRGKNRYISDLIIPENSPLVGQNAAQFFEERSSDIELFQVFRNYAILDPVRDRVILRQGDEILVKASAQHLTQILDSRHAVLPHEDSESATRPHDSNFRIVELLVHPNSNAVGQSLNRFIASLDAHIKVLGVNRHWKHYPAGKVRNLRLALGDIILVQSPLDHLEQIRSAEELIVIEDVHKSIVNRKKAPLAMGIFLMMILATTFGVADILVSAMTAMLLMILTGCISLREAYRSIDSKVLILIIGTIALGNALSITGAADLYTRILLKPLVGMSPYIVLSAFILLTSLLSLFLSNNSTAVLLMPIALSTAAALNVDPRAFVIGLCFGASACYATPIGYQTNLLVYGPGGYVFKDYLKLGIPLSLGVWIVSSLVIPLLWPF
ncbi:MAG: SLC13 family permease [Acidobacteria bacterium]|nr:SLC13 family permease [Acidobacteriota bacterium]